MTTKAGEGALIAAYRTVDAQAAEIANLRRKLETIADALGPSPLSIDVEVEEIRRLKDRVTAAESANASLVERVRSLETALRAILEDSGEGVDLFTNARAALAPPSTEGR